MSALNQVPGVSPDTVNTQAYQNPPSRPQTPLSLAAAIPQPINLRALVSLEESSRIIGSKGSSISTVRETNNVKIGISKAVPGCSDRILSCFGHHQNVSNALGDVVELLLPNPDAPITPSKKYHFPFLNHILPPPTIEELGDPSHLYNIGYLRLIIPNSQISSIIGKNGSTIKSLIDRHGVKIVASKEFLPDSDERVLELQGFSGSISNVLLDICRIIANTEATYAARKALEDPTVEHNKERKYYPHLRMVQDSDRVEGGGVGNDSNGNGNGNRNDGNGNGVEYRATVLVPEMFVGPMMGRKANRIISLGSFTDTRITVSPMTEGPEGVKSGGSGSGNNNGNTTNENDTSGGSTSMNASTSGVEGDEPVRYSVFTVTGHSAKGVNMAESMLLKNLETEIQRRQQRLQQAKAAPETAENSSPLKQETP